MLCIVGSVCDGDGIEACLESCFRNQDKPLSIGSVCNRDDEPPVRISVSAAKACH